jgi:hypothetical protein
LLSDGLAAPSYRLLSKETGISRSTLFDLDHKDLSHSAIEERHRLQCSNRKLLPWQEQEVLGYIFYRCIHSKSTASERVKRYIFRRFNVSVGKGWLSLFMERAHLSSQLCVSTKIEELSHEKLESAIAALTEFRKLNIDPAQIVSVDKIYFKDLPSSCREWAPKGLCALFLSPVSSSLSPQRYTSPSSCANVLLCRPVLDYSLR